MLTLALLSANWTEAREHEVATQSSYLFWIDEGDMITAKIRAQKFLAALDQSSEIGKDLHDVYANASHLLQVRYTERAYNERLEALRKPLGKVKRRVLRGVDGGYKTLPNRPLGQYVIVVFNTNFANNTDIYTEQVTLARESSTSSTRDSTWKIVEYYCGTKPYYSEPQ